MHVGTSRRLHGPKAQPVVPHKPNVGPAVEHKEEKKYEPREME